MIDGEFIHKVSFNDRFTTFHNFLWEDERLSWEAKGLLAYMISRPKDWKIHKIQLAKIYKGPKKTGGLDCVKSIFKELIEKKYIIYTKTHNDEGFFVHAYQINREVLKNDK